MKAALALDYGHLSVADVVLDPPRAGEVMIRMAATGVCWSDLSVLKGTVPMPLPMALGHEGAGVVPLRHRAFHHHLPQLSRR